MNTHAHKHKNPKNLPKGKHAQVNASHTHKDTQRYAKLSKTFKYTQKLIDTRTNATKHTHVLKRTQHTDTNTISQTHKHT